MTPRSRWQVAAAYAVSPPVTAFAVSVLSAPELVVFMMLYAVLLFSAPAFALGRIQTAILHKGRPFRMIVLGLCAFILCLLSSLCFNPPVSGSGAFWNLTMWPPVGHLQLAVYGVLTTWLLDCLITAALNRKAV